MTDEKIEEALARVFEESRAHLRAVAHRMLGSTSEAEDAVQEAWLRSSRADRSEVDNLRGWLTTVLARVCLDMLRSRKARAKNEEFTGVAPPDVVASPDKNAEQEAVLADSVGLALLVVLDTLEPAERLAFVLHDLFGVSFDEIAPIVGRTEVATRQLASRARRRVRGAPERDEAELGRQHDVVKAFIAALRAGDVEGVVAVLDPNVVVSAGGGREVRGAREWAKSATAFARNVRSADSVEAAIVDGTVGTIYAPNGRLTSALKLTFAGDRIVRVDIMADADSLADVAIESVD